MKFKAAAKSPKGKKHRASIEMEASAIDHEFIHWVQLKAGIDFDKKYKITIEEM